MCFITVRILIDLIERENFQNSDSPFLFLFGDFRLCSSYDNVCQGAWHVHKPLLGSSIATWQPSWKKKLERNSENGQTLCKSADDVTALAQLRVLQPDNALVTPMIARVISEIYYDIKRGGSYKMFHYYKIPQSNDTVSHLRLHPNKILKQ